MGAFSSIGNMDKLNLKLVLFFLLAPLVGLLAQPSISNIDPETTNPNGEVVISGSGFGTNANDVVIWFGAVKATSILSITNSAIRVLAPAGATHAPITVERISTGLLARSTKYFYLSHAGSDFDLTQLTTPVRYLNGSIELFDICGCDFDGDGLVDFATTQTSGTQVSIMRNISTLGNINFSTQALNATTPTTGINCADLDGDGKQDLFMTRAGSNRNQLYIYRNTSSGPGTIAFGAQQFVNLETNNSTTNPYQAVRVLHGDMNGDGKPDLVVSNGNTSERLINIIANTSTIGAISFATPTKIPTPQMTTNNGLSLDDIDNDGALDIILTRTLAADVYAYRNLGGLQFDNPVVLSTSSEAITNVSAIDLNNDGFKEIITSEVFSEEVLIYPNNSTSGTLNFAAPVKFVVGNEPWTVKGTDIDGDGLLDLVVGNRAENAYSILMNNGGLSFNVLKQSVEQATRNIFAGDMDGDAKPDLAFTSLIIPEGGFSVQVVKNTNCYQPYFFNETPLALCPTQSTTLSVPDSPGTTFSWTRDGGDIGETTSSIDITLSGNYEVTAVSESGTCTTTASIMVNDGSGSTPAVPTPSNNGPGCVGESITLTVPTQSGATYEWSGPNGYSSNEQNPVLTNLSANDAGLYTVIVSIGDCLSSSGETEVVVSDLGGFSINAGGATTICAGSAVSLSTQNRSGVSYQWKRNGADAGGATNTFSATQSGDYTVTITDNTTGCTFTTSELQVNVLAQPIADFTVNNPICTGIEVDFINNSTVDGGATPVYNWDFGDGSAVNSVDAIHAYASSGSFDVTLTISYDAISGCSTSTTQTIQVVDAASVNITASKNSICEGESVDLTANGDFSNLVWSGGESSATITVEETGIYEVTATDANGCISTDDLELFAGEVPEINILANGEPGPIEIDFGLTVQLEATGADSYLWSPQEFLSDVNVANPIANPTITTTFAVIGALAAGCTATETIEIIVGAPSNEINVNPVKAFAPDNIEDAFWRVLSIENYPDNTLSIFDERGSLVFREQGYNNTWDGTFEGSPLPEGVYYFVLSVPTFKNKTGAILLVRE